MNHALKPFALFFGRWHPTNLEDRSSTIKSPIGFSAWVCLACLALTYLVARPLVGLLDVGWTILAMYGVLPVSVTFIILYRGCWHREITGVPRTLSLIFLSFIVFAGDLIASIILLILGALVYSTFIDGFNRMHY